MTGIRGTIPVNPRDWTGKQLQQQQKTRMDSLRAARNIEVEIEQAYRKGHDAGWAEAMDWVRGNYDLSVKPDEDEDEDN